MDTPTKTDFAPILRAILSRKPAPYYNEQGFKNKPTKMEPEAEWPRVIIHDLPAEQHDWRDDIKD